MTALPPPPDTPQPLPRIAIARPVAWLETGIAALVVWWFTAKHGGL